jgi:poly-beta-1,6-N-acetyl-D-glucosamine N-deacetylase
MTASSLTKDLIRNLIFRLGLPYAGLRWFPGGCILPLLFHNPDKQLFNGLIERLIDTDFTFISTDQLMDIIKGRIKMRQKAVWMSFDDGHRGNLDNVLPTLTHHALPAIFFLSPVPIESEEGVTWVRLAMENSNLLPIPYKQLTKISNVRRKEIIETIARAERFKLPRQMMTKSEVQDLAQLPFITIGSHTANHVVMPNCTETELDSEIAESTQSLSAWIGKKIHYFSYPFGCFTVRERDFLRRHGYILAATSQRTTMDIRDIESVDTLQIPRIDVDDNATVSNMLYDVGAQCLVRILKTSVRVKRNSA